MSPPMPAVLTPAAATTPPFLSLSQTHRFQFFHHHQSPFPSALTSPPFLKLRRSNINHGPPSSSFSSPRASISRLPYEGSRSRTYDPELRFVLELATDSELYELEKILFGPSYFSPLLKSITKRDEVDYVMIGEDPDKRENFISMLESRFLYLAADARSTLRGWRPSYRNVLLEVRKRLKIPCSAKLSTEDLEVEIFLHLLQEYSSEEPGNFQSPKGSSTSSEVGDNLELGLSRWKVQSVTAIGFGATELRSTILKGGGMLAFEKFFAWVEGRLSGKMFVEAAKYQMKKEVIGKGGQLAAISLETQAALLAAKQGLKVAATRYLGLRSVAQLLGPMMWGTLLADVVIQMLGTDYARILRAVYAFAQIRIYRSYGIASDY
ncbi:Hypothetical predicted protein [Olea europaea subsp. europaea]|uniref:Uncharacterized protein n=1 Tax=Olea europaea subsp. europaea TaxID=158383 RepID=A0A8S0PMZ6_OLEEU|nr:Hypothetical predicted protein [Olea europaea subsp. europaea]